MKKIEIELPDTTYKLISKICEFLKITPQQYIEGQIIAMMDVVSQEIQRMGRDQYIH